MRKLTTLFAVFLLFVTFSNVGYAKKSFSDIAGKNQGHFEAIHFLNDAGIYDYKTTAKFNVNAAVTRGEMSKILHNLLVATAEEEVLPRQRSYNGQFKDVSNKTPYASEIIWAYEVGIFDGNESGQFNPNQPVKRAHLAKILATSFQLEKQGTYQFKDVSRSSWYYDFVNILASNGITTGNEKNQFLPNDNVTSGQMATFIYRTLQLYEPSIAQYSEQVEIVTPVSESSKPQVATTDVLYTEYDFNWHVVGKNEQLTLEGIVNNKVVAGYLTVKGDSFSGAPIRIGTHTAADVTKQLGKPLNAILKSNTNYFFETNNEFAMYLIDDYYVTYFFDVHKKNSVRSILYVSKDQEHKKADYYGTKNKILKAQNHSEQLMVELMNQSRTVEGLQPLRYAKEWAKVARGHSADMATNNFFDHINLRGEEPYDRMKRGGMDVDKFRTWGENISYGQFSVIYAHEGLMNSLGHRVNILNGKFENAITGVDISSDNVPYYTIKFYTLQ